MTGLQLVPSAQAPWTRTIFGRVVITVFPFAGGFALQSLRGQPGQGGVGDLFPAAVDGEGVTAVLELLELGDRGGVAVLLQGGPGGDVRDGVVFGPGDEQQRTAGLVPGVDLGLRVEG